MYIFISDHDKLPAYTWESDLEEQQKKKGEVNEETKAKL